MLYAALNLVRGQSLVPEAYSFIHVILATPSIHLWYLPYIFFVLVLIDWVKHYLLTRQSAVFVAVLATLLLISAPIGGSGNRGAIWAVSACIACYFNRRFTGPIQAT